MIDFPLRSVLYVPADKPRALAKSGLLDADAVIFDLEDAVAPDAKPAGREALRIYFRDAPRPVLQKRIIRINGLDTPFGVEDLLAARACNPDAILVPKVSVIDDIQSVFDALSETDAPSSLAVWAMIETARGVANCAAMAQAMPASATRLQAFVLGTNDLFVETGLSGPHMRQVARPWLMQVVLGARCGRLAVLDGVFNDHRDTDRFEQHCRDGVQMGFDGVTVIHPSQIAAANHAYQPDDQTVANARAIVDAFKQPENAAKGVISLGGQMVERLHLAQAQAVIAKAQRIADEQS